jgi:NTE family protein
MEFRLGIVLSGGGSRGLVHAGVLRALTEQGIEPACVSGSSSGAIVGALYAAGYSAPEMVEFFDVASPFRFSKLALGKPGFFDTEKVVDDFRRYFPDDSFSALRRKLFVTATDLVRARSEVFAAGPLVRPVIASSSVPLVFTPITIDGRLFADGGILDNFPVEPLLGLCDVLLGVYASPLSHRDRPDLGSSFAVAQRAFEIGMYSASRRRFHRCDLVISPPALTGYSMFDAKRHAEIVEVGYRATLERMEEIRQLLDGGAGAERERPPVGAE